MRMDKFTTKFSSALSDAQSIAIGDDHQFIEPLHLMAALLDQLLAAVDEKPRDDNAGIERIEIR